MKKLVLALAALGVIGLAAPATQANAAPLDGRLQLARADVKVKVRPGHHRTVKKVIVRRDRGLHRGWHHHHRRHGASKVIVIKRPGHAVVKKRVIVR